MNALNIARLIKAFAPTWVMRPRSPVRAVVALTRQCNLRCAMCHSASLPRGRQMTPVEVGRLFFGMPNLVWLDLTGGEPFIRSDIAEVFDAVLTNTPSLAVLHFPTNGWHRERILECAMMIHEMRPDVSLLVTVSIDGPRDVHDRVRGRDGSFDRAFGTFLELRRVPGVQTFIGTTVGPWNRDALGGLHSFLIHNVPDFDDRCWHWNQAQVSSHFFANEGLPSLEGGDAAVLIREHMARRWPPRSPVDLMELAYLVNVHGYLSGEPAGIACQALRSSCFVSADAVMYPCHVWDMPVADLRSSDFNVEQVWDGADVLDARRQVDGLECGGCFTPCEAYTSIAGSPVRATLLSAIRAGLVARRSFS
ncbi:MAG: radical SAM protein [Deltaproteobacteria bacterium]|nr:radical SAM protein [Deltaproteobacteria bacterium]